MTSRAEPQPFDRRKAFIRAIAGNDKEMLQALADEKEGKLRIITNEAEENKYLKELYQAVMCAPGEEPDLDSLPDPFYANGYQSALHHLLNEQA